jgi:hypothetical protein
MLAMLGLSNTKEPTQARHSFPCRRTRRWSACSDRDDAVRCTRMRAWVAVAAT